MAQILVGRQGLKAEAFRKALWSGHGRALLYARHHDVTEFREIILDACLHCRAVDPQCEGTRIGFMGEILDIIPDRGFYRDAILKSLAYLTDDYHGVLRFGIAVDFAKNGDAEARRLVYEHFRPYPVSGDYFASSLTYLDGIPGLLFAADRLGAALLQGVKLDGAGWWLAGASCGEDEARNALQAAAIDSPNVAAYCTENAAVLESEPITKVAGLTYAEVKALRPSSSRARKWAEKANAADIAIAAQDLLAATTLEEQRMLLSIFMGAAFPGSPGPIIAFAQSEDRRLRNIAGGALARIAHPDVRNFALSSGHLERMDILSTNFQPGDHAVAQRWFEEAADHDRHGLGMNLRRFWKAHPQPETEVMMLFSIYEHQPCSVCRSFSVRRLIELEALPPELREECRFDASDEIRELVATPACNSTPLN